MPPPRWKRVPIDVRDVMPATLRVRNKGPLVERLKSYHRHYTTNPEYVNHPESRVGRYTTRVNRLEDADTNFKVRQAWGLIENWAENRGITILQ